VDIPIQDSTRFNAGFRRYSSALIEADAKDDRKLNLKGWNNNVEK
jgi:hypothetical protein